MSASIQPETALPAPNPTWAATEEEEQPFTDQANKRNSQAKFANESIFAKIAYHPYFESLTMSVIVCNAAWIGIDTEKNHSSMKENGKLPLEPGSIVVENIFCVYFTIELVIRFLAYKSKLSCFWDAWFVFDSLLVACMILETWIMVIIEAIMSNDDGGGVGPLSALRLLRLLRLARVGRLMKFVPELGKLVKGMIKAARSVIFILIFLILVMYVFAIVFTGTLTDKEKYPRTPYCSKEIAAGLNETDDCLPDGEFGELAQDLFATMGDSLMSLFTRGVLGDNLDETVDAIMEQSIPLMWAFFIFLIITFATLLNMLIGVVCEVISDAAAEEEEGEKVNTLSEVFQETFTAIDENMDGRVTMDEWKKIKSNDKVRKSLAGIGIEDDRMEERLDQMSKMLFDGEDAEEEELGKPGFAGTSSMTSTQTSGRNGLSVDELIQKVINIRPDQNASALDLELLRAQVAKDQDLFKKRLRRIEGGIKNVLGVSGGGGAMPGRPGNGNSPGPRPPPAANVNNQNSMNAGGNRMNNVDLSEVPTNMLFESMSDRARSGNFQQNR